MQENSKTSDIIVDIKSIPIIIPKYHRTPFKQPYIEKVFYIWYNHGKPGATSLRPYISPELDDWGRIPALSLLSQWITDYFKPRADDLDRRVREQLEASIVFEKVEMLKRHADLGTRMQNIAVQYLNDNLDELSAPAAVRLLVEGVRIERESRGISDALDKMSNMSDEKLMEEIKGLLTSGSLSIEELDASS